MSIPVYLVAVLATILDGMASAYSKLRYPFCIGPLTVAAAGLAVLLAQDQVSAVFRYTACFFVVSGVFAGQSIGISWLSNNVLGKKRRGIALGLMVGLGNCGFLLGSNVFLKSEEPRYATGFSVCLGAAVLAVVAAIGFLVYLMRENERRELGQEKSLLARSLVESVSLGEQHSSFRYVY